MSAKSDDTAFSKLTETVLSMEKRIISLEKLVEVQNSLIKQLISNREVSSEVSNGRPAAATSPRQPVTRPVREARIRAQSAMADPRKPMSKGKKGTGNISPSLSTGRAVQGSLNSTASLSQSAPPTPLAPDTPPPAPPSLKLQIPSITMNIPAPAASQAPQNETDNNEDWVEVVRRRTRAVPANVIRGTATPGSTLCALSAAERKSYLHLYFVQIGTTVDQVLAHLQLICPGDKCIAEALKSRGDYASFKLSVPSKNVERYLKPDYWAEGVHIKPWRSGFRFSQQQEGQ